MKQEIIDKIKRDYNDYTKMVETNFEEMHDENTTPGRYKRVKGIKEKYLHWVTSEDIDIDDYVMDEAIKTNLQGVDIGDTNKIYMYITEMHYETFSKLFKDEIMYDQNPDSIYVLYMDIEDNKKIFIQKKDQEVFETTHDVIVKYKNKNCNAGCLLDRNLENIDEARREFIRSALDGEQGEAAKQFVKRYQEMKKEGN